MSYSGVCTQIRNSENKLSSVVIYSYYLSKLATFRMHYSKCNTILNILEIFTTKFASHYNRKKKSKSQCKLTKLHLEQTGL